MSQVSYSCAAADGATADTAMESVRSIPAASARSVDDPSTWSDSSPIDSLQEPKKPNLVLQLAGQWHICLGRLFLGRARRSRDGLMESCRCRGGPHHPSVLTP